MAKLTQTVAIRDARFHSPIGYYEEERILGNDFLVSASVEYLIECEGTDVLEDTLNYEKIYETIKNVMSPERKLLESAASEILHELRSLVPDLEKAEVCIKKISPPFGGDISKSEVTLRFEK